MAFIVPIEKRRIETGQRFGRLCVLGVPFYVIRQTVVCECECGSVGLFPVVNLLRKNTQRCAGCRGETHGMSRTAAYRTWCHMLERCSNPNCKDYPDYGGRGVVVCNRWRLAFENFIEDMGPRPNGTSIDRIDNSKGYSPDNCRWAGTVAQARNKRNNRWVTINGVRKMARDWCQEFRMSRFTFYKRLKDGMSDVEALTTPKYRY